jgi:hypothetical protein
VATPHNPGKSPFTDLQDEQWVRLQIDDAVGISDLLPIDGYGTLRD